LSGNPATDLPASWSRSELSALAELVRGVSYKKEDSSASPFISSTPLLRATNITGSSLTFDDLVYVPNHYVSPEQYLQKGDIVIASSSGSKEVVGKSGQLMAARERHSFGAFCTGIRPVVDIEPRYLGYYFESPEYRDAISDISAGSSINNIKSSDLAVHFVPVAPRAEQTRIVEKLEELLSDLDAGVAELKAAQRKLAQYRQSLLKAAVEGALTADWRARRRSPQPHQGGGAETTEAAEAREADDADRDEAMTQNAARPSASATARERSPRPPTASGCPAPLPPRGGGAGGEGEHHHGTQAHATQPSSAAGSSPATIRSRSPRPSTATGHPAPLPPRGGGVGGEGANHGRHPSPALLRQRARDMRHEPTPQEHQLWQQLRAKRFAGYKFRRQQPIGRYIVDFICFAERLIVELDGGQHADAGTYDAERDRWLQSQGFRVLRFWNNEWAQHTDAVLDAIWAALQASPAVSDADAAAPPPLPNPSPARGEGLESETGAELLQRILRERRVRWEQKQLAKFAEQGKTPPKGWQDKYPEPVAPDLADLPPLPEGWVWATYEQVSARVTVGHVGPMKQHYIASGVPFLRSQNVRENRFSEEGLLFISKEFHEQLSKSKLQPGDIVVVRSGSVGVSCVIPDGLEEANCSDLVIVQEPHGVLPSFGTYYLNSAAKRDVRRGQSGIALTHFNTQAVAALRICVPPLEEQARIVEIVEDGLAAIDRLDLEIASQLKIAAAQRKNILKAAFSGQLVPQDPNDEPSSALLARIRAQREADAGAPARKRGRKAKGAA
jgi:very-short-patch-repair endonuclease/restriction endonuclease S subunit